ncbi:hypothetical protein Ga0466249_002296 [Sporomusaceae bacterium BoRhaA]|uniref:hypothetical protein n=1 Tax=Pelorhabdus rhamnosifermentans TaxID=2772457 RepID=UPI001C060F93|nr:hypothetical protein [Pelorhabdus rhamnosifermentans]MBU2701182.1 hypothetical protein [Pelorhabdus rhamnosifermentans]
MSFIDVYCATEYMIDNPPAGTVIQMALDAYCKGAAKVKGGTKNNVGNDSYESSNDGGQPHPSNWDSLTKEQRFAFESQQLEAFKAMFGMSGGVVRKGKGGA